MSLVAIVGAGEIGGAAARALAFRSRVDVVRLIDGQESVAAGKALDLLQAGPVRGSDTRVESAADLSAASGAAAIVLADPAGSAEWTGESGLGALRQLLKLGCLEHAVLICAGAGHRTLMQQGLDELRLPRRRVIGSAPEALAATARALVAIETRAASNQVTLVVLGNPPARMVIPWAHASVGGHSIESMLTASQLHQSGKTVARPVASWAERTRHGGRAVLRGCCHWLATPVQRIRFARPRQRYESARLCVARIDWGIRTGTHDQSNVDGTGSRCDG